MESTSNENQLYMEAEREQVHYLSRLEEKTNPEGWLRHEYSCEIRLSLSSPFGVGHSREHTGHGIRQSGFCFTSWTPLDRCLKCPIPVSQFLHLYIETSTSPYFFRSVVGRV